MYLRARRPDLSVRLRFGRIGNRRRGQIVTTTSRSGSSGDRCASSSSRRTGAATAWTILQIDRSGLPSGETHERIDLTGAVADDLTHDEALAIVAVGPRGR
jgi:hypothetical protein